MLIPAGLLFFIFGILIILPIAPERRGDLFDLMILPLMIIVVVRGTWQPNWLTPRWLWWLETNYLEHLQLLHDEACNMERWKWNRRVRTQEGLDSWMEEVLIKNNISST